MFSNYLTGLSPATRTQSDPRADASANVVAESWEMFVSDLVARLPGSSSTPLPEISAPTESFRSPGYPRLQSIVDRNYSPIGEVAGTRVFARRSHDG